MQQMELAILDFIQNHLKCGFLDAVLPPITHICDHGEVWILLAFIFLIWRKKRCSGLGIAHALVLDLATCNIILKPLFNRIRPFMVNTAVELMVEPPLDASFPSGHTAASFAAVFALMAAKDPLWKPAMGLAVVIAFSRMYLYVHWPSDILGGILVGAFAGFFGVWISKKLFKKIWAKQS